MYQRLVLLIFGIVVIGGLMYYVGFTETLNAIFSMRPEYFVLLLALQLTTMVLSALKWRLILRHIKVSFRNVLACTFVGYLVNNITPLGTAGGEPVKAYMLSKKEGIPVEKAFSSVIVDLFIEIIPIFLLSAIAIFIIIVSGIPLEVAAAIFFASVLLLGLFVMCLLFVTNEQMSYRIMNLLVAIATYLPVLRKKKGRIKEEADAMYARFNDAMKKQMLDNYILGYGTLISMAVWILRVLRVYLIFLAFGINISLPTLLIVETAVIVVTFIPISPGALGVWEATSIGLFAMLGVPMVHATSVTIIDRIIFYVFPSVLGIGAATYLGMDVLKLVKKEVEDKVDIENVSRVVGVE